MNRSTDDPARRTPSLGVSVLLAAVPIAIVLALSFPLFVAGVVTGVVATVGVRWLLGTGGLGPMRRIALAVDAATDRG